MAYMKNLKLFILILLLAAASSANAEIINRVYAVVGEKVITQYELESLNPKRLQTIYQRLEGEKRKNALTSYYTQALDLLVDNYVIEQAASREGVRVSNKEVSMAVEDIMEKNNVDEERLNEMLAASNQTLEQYKWKIKIDILKARLMSTVFKPKIVVTEEDITKYIENHADALELSDTYELRMITVESESDLNTVMAEYEKTKSFRDVAMKYSTAKSAENGGYLGWVEIAFLDQAVRDAVAGVKEGITKPIQDDNGYRVFYVEGFRTKNEIDKNKRETIIKLISGEESKRIFESWLAEKKKEILIQKKYAY